MKSNKELREHHAAALECVKHLKHIAGLLCLVEYETDEARWNEAAKGLEVAMRGLVPAYWEKLPSEFAGRQVLISAAREAGTAPTKFCGTTASVAHDAVFGFVGSVLFHIACSLCWSEWLSEDPPWTFDREITGKEAEHVVAVLVKTYGHEGLDESVCDEAKAWLEIEYSAVKEEKQLPALEGAKKDLVEAVRDIGPEGKRTQAAIFAYLEAKGIDGSEGHAKTCLAELVRSGHLVKGEGGYRLPEW